MASYLLLGYIGYIGVQYVNLFYLHEKDLVRTYGISLHCQYLYDVDVTTVMCDMCLVCFCTNQ